jgi:hypothetical protein
MKTACGILALAAGLTALPPSSLAQPVTADRDNVRIAGMAGKTPLNGSLRLVASEEIGGFTLLVSDLMDDGGGPPPRDAIAASAVTVTPAIQDGRLRAGTQQFAFQLAVPSETGRWKGTVLVLWETPAPGRLELPVLVTTRSQPTLALATPQQLSFAAASGESIQFRFQLKETSKGSPSAGVKVLATDLRGTTGTRLLRADKIRAAPESDTLAGGALMPVSVTIDLHEAKSGKYTGQLMVSDAYHNDIAVPLEVSVKDRWPLPLLVLLFGVAAGMTISGYRARGRPRDELMMRIEAVREQLTEASALKQALEPLVQRILVEVSAHIEARKWDAAKEAAARAEALVLRWRGDEEAWSIALKRLQDVRRKLDDLVEAAIVVQLRRHLERLDLATLASAKALAEEADKAEDLVAFLRRMYQLVDKVASDMEELSSATEKRALSKELDNLRVSLGELKADNKALEDALSAARALQRKVQDVLEKEAALKQEIGVLEAETEKISGELRKPAASKAGRSIAQLASDLRSESADDEPLEVQRQRIENIWRGLWSAKAMLQLDAREPRSAEDKALAAWLGEAGTYRRSPQDFEASIETLEANLPDASWPNGLRPKVPKLPRPREMRGKGTGLSAELARDSFSTPPVVEKSVEPQPPPAPETLWRRVLGRLSPRAAGERSRLRLALFRYSTYALALGLLVWMGFAEIYAASPTFGADGAKDYLVLFLWGFGAEATRSAVTEVVKGLAPAT